MRQWKFLIRPFLFYEWRSMGDLAASFIQSCRCQCIFSQLLCICGFVSEQGTPKSSGLSSFHPPNGQFARTPAYPVFKHPQRYHSGSIPIKSNGLSSFSLSNFSELLVYLRSPAEHCHIFLRFFGQPKSQRFAFLRQRNSTLWRRREGESLRVLMCFFFGFAWCYLSSKNGAELNQPIYFMVYGSLGDVA